MTTGFEIFVESLPQIFLNAINKEFILIRKENHFSAYAQAMKNVYERLIQNDTDYSTLKNQLSEDALTQILRVTLRLLKYSIGVRECSPVISDNQDPIVQVHYSSILYNPGELEKTQQFLTNQWIKVGQLEKKGISFTFADKMDVLLALVTNAGKMYAFDVLSKYEEEILQLISESPKCLLSKFYEGLFYTTLSFWLREKGDLNRAIMLNELALNYAEEIKLPYLLGYTTNTNGAIFMWKGDFLAALQQFNESLKYLKTIDDIQGMAYAYNNIGVIQNTMGYFTNARQSFLKSNELHLQSTGQIFRTVIYSNIASTYRAEGNIVEALKTIQEGLYIEQQNKQTSLDLLYLLSEQIEIYLDNEDIISARDSLQDLEKAITSLDSKTFIPLYHYYMGILEAKEVNFGVAKKELLKAIENSGNSPDNYRTMLRAEIQLVNVLLSSYQFTRNIAEFDQAFTLIENIIKACREQELLPLLCDVLVIRAYLYSTQDQLDRSKEDLIEAIDTAEKLGLQIQLSRAKEYFEPEKDIQENLTPLEKINKLLAFLKTSSSSILSFHLFKKPIPIEAKLYGLLFSTESGVPIYSKYFDDRLLKNDILISGLLSGISNFTKELLSVHNPGSLKSISHEDIIILIEKVKSKFLVVFFADKDTHDIRTKLSLIVREIEHKVAGINLQFDQSYVEKNPSLEKIFDESINKIYPTVNLNQYEQERNSF